MMTYDDLIKANESIAAIGIERKDKDTGKTVVKAYAEVAQRVKAFRSIYPDGRIETTIEKLEDGEVTMRAAVFRDTGELLSTGTASETKGSSFINKTSYIENCETSAVGRALAFLGIGIDTAIASKEEVENARRADFDGILDGKIPEKPDKASLDTLKDLCSKHHVDLEQWAKTNGTTVDTLTAEECAKLLKAMKAKYKDA